MQSASAPSTSFVTRTNDGCGTWKPCYCPMLARKPYTGRWRRATRKKHCVRSLRELPFPLPRPASVGDPGARRLASGDDNPMTPTARQVKAVEHRTIHRHTKTKVQRFITQSVCQTLPFSRVPGSPSWVPVPIHSCGRCPCLASSAPIFRSSFSDFCCAVSYTHLRAHETLR